MTEIQDAILTRRYIVPQSITFENQPDSATSYSGNKLAQSDSMNNSVLTMSLVFVAMPLFGQTDDKRAGKGRDVFEEYCVGCHGPDGRAETDMSKKVGAADLTSGAVQEQSDSHLRTVIKDGKGKMPACSQKLSDGEISSVLSYVRQMAQR